MEKVCRKQALSKSEFHQRLHDWLNNTDDATIGPEGLDGRTAWVHVREDSSMFALHADTPRNAVDCYLQMVTQYGTDMQWEIAESQRGKMTVVVCGPGQVRIKSFYLYAVGSQH